MPTTPIYALRYPAPADPADVPTDMGELATDTEAAIRKAGIVYGTTPPASPVDGDLWCFPADTTNGVMWLFRYRAGSASTYKWEFVGGSSYQQLIFTNESTPGGTYGDLATPGPSFTVPRAGDYLVEFGFLGSNNTAGCAALASPNSDDTNVAQVTSSTASAYQAVAASKRLVSMTASQLLKMQYRQSSGGTAAFLQRWLKVTPIRVA